MAGGAPLRYTPCPVRAKRLLNLTIWLLPAWTPVTVVTRDPVPPGDRLEAGDCAFGAKEYAARLRPPPETTRVPLRRPLPPDAPRSADEFDALCRRTLAGKARRVVTRCWQDAGDAATLLGC